MLKQVNTLWLDLKIWLRVNFFYPRHSLTMGIKSIIPSNIKLNQGIRIEKNAFVSAHVESIGKHVYIGSDTMVDYCRSIGNFSCISYGVKIGLRDHALDMISINPLCYSARRGWIENDFFDEKEKGMVEIGGDVLISANAIILRGVKIGHGAVIGAGAVVLNDIPPYAIAAGVPAKIIRYRFDEVTINKLLDSHWWEIADEKIISLNKYFNNPLEFLERLHK